MHPAVLSPEALRVKVKTEKISGAFRALKNAGPQAIDLDTPSPSPKKRPQDADASQSMKRARAAPASASTSNIPNPEFPSD